jgi:dihydropteroate synthase
VVAETLAWLFERVETLHALGMGGDQLAVDPGIAFGKSHDEDLETLRRIGELQTVGQPLLLAHSRKNFIGSVSGRPPVDRDLETHVVTALAFEQGVRLFRVHDVEGARRALAMASAVATGLPGEFGPDAESWPWRAGASVSHMTRGEAGIEAPQGQRW